MKTLLLTLFLVARCALAQLDDVAFVGSLTTASASTPPNLLTQDFESGSIPSGWSVPAGAPVWNYTPALSGSYSLGCVLDDYTRVGFSASSEVYVFCEIKFTEASWGLGGPMIQIRDSGGVMMLALIGNYSSTFTVYDADYNYPSGTVSAASASTKYYIWLHYKAGTGANGIVSCAFSSTLSEPTSGDNFTSRTTATGTANVSEIRFINLVTGSGTIIFDNVAISTQPMPNGWSP